MIATRDFKRGQFTYAGSDGRLRTVPIDFNPATLDYRVSRNVRGEGAQTQQAAGTASASLTLDLIFDTTDTGDDVRSKTSPIEFMLRPQPPTGGENGPPQAPPMITFEWGAFKFVGIVNSFRQTLDFFSAHGVPLRAAVNVQMSQPNYQFDGAGDSGFGPGDDQTVVLPGGSPFQLAVEVGDPSAARGIASVNGLESLRAPAGSAIAVGGPVSIAAAVGFSAGAGLGLGIGVGTGPAPSAGFGASAGTSASAPIASARMAASDGAFDALHAPRAPGSAKPANSQRLLAHASAPGIAPGAVFDVTGKAVAQSASTFKADVGTSRIRFDDHNAG